jgi:raffinose/stachyose/melibiose transport system permease protein
MFLAFRLCPLIGVLVLSFTDWDGIGAIKFVGGQSWVQVMTDPGTWHALYLTFAVMIITWLVQTPISLLLGTFHRWAAALSGPSWPCCSSCRS